MMKSVLAASAAVIALGAVSAAHAQSMPAQAYATFGGAYYFGDDIDIPLAQLRLGVNIGENFGVEAEGSLGISDDNITPTASVEIDHILAAFARVRAPVGPNAEVFARVGYYTAEMSASAPGISVSADGDDFAAGAGVEFGLGGRTGLRLDYTNYGFDDAHNVGAALVVKF